MIFERNFYIISVIALIGSTHAAKTSQTTEVVGFVNGDKSFVCNGNNIKWFYPNSSEIHGSSSKYQISTTEEESILTVKKIDMISLGAYKCITFLNSSYVEKYFNLKLYYPLTINHIARITVAKENESVTLKCKTVSVPQAEKITWYFEEEELALGKNYSRLNDGILINNVQVDQAGTYSCVAIQELDELKNVQEREMELIVEYGPKQTSSEPIKIFSTIGETVILNCNAKSDPIPRFSWLRNNYETFQNVKIRDFSSSLTVKIENEESFADIYNCIAYNDHGRSNQTFVLEQRSEILNSDVQKTSDVSKILIALIASLMIFI